MADSDDSDDAVVYLEHDAEELKQSSRQLRRKLSSYTEGVSGSPKAKKLRPPKFRNSTNGKTRTHLADSHILEMMTHSEELIPPLEATPRINFSSYTPQRERWNSPKQSNSSSKSGAYAPAFANPGGNTGNTGDSITTTSKDRVLFTSPHRNLISGGRTTGTSSQVTSTRRKAGLMSDVLDRPDHWGGVSRRKSTGRVHRSQDRRTRRTSLPVTVPRVPATRPATDSSVSFLPSFLSKARNRDILTDEDVDDAAKSDDDRPGTPPFNSQIATLNSPPSSSERLSGRIKRFKHMSDGPLLKAYRGVVRERCGMRVGLACQDRGRGLQNPRTRAKCWVDIEIVGRRGITAGGLCIVRGLVIGTNSSTVSGDKSFLETGTELEALFKPETGKDGNVSLDDGCKIRIYNYFILMPTPESECHLPKAWSSNLVRLLCTEICELAETV